MMQKGDKDEKNRGSKYREKWYIYRRQEGQELE
jgi:hypothetical protein